MGIDNHSVSSIPVATAGGVVNSAAGPIIAILHQHEKTAAKANHIAYVACISIECANEVVNILIR